MPSGLPLLELESYLPEGRGRSPCSGNDRRRASKSRVAALCKLVTGHEAGTPSSTKEVGINRRGIKGQKINSPILGFMRRRIIDSSWDVSRKYASSLLEAKCFELK